MFPIFVCLFFVCVFLSLHFIYPSFAFPCSTTRINLSIIIVWHICIGPTHWTCSDQRKSLTGKMVLARRKTGNLRAEIYLHISTFSVPVINAYLEPSNPSANARKHFPCLLQASFFWAETTRNVHCEPVKANAN